MSKQFTEEQLDIIFSRLFGTSDSCEDLAEEMGCESDDIEYAAEMERNITRCNECGWWVECGQCNENNVCDECEPWEE